MNDLTALISGNIFIALIASFVAGIVSSFSPCLLSTVPLVIGYVEANGKKNKNLALKYSLVFSLGLIFTFVALGVASAVLGKFFAGGGKLWYLALGVIMMFVGLKTIGVLGSKESNSCKVPRTSKGVVGAFFLGILGGVLSSPCATPILAAILAFVASSGNIVLGILMLLLYSVGHCILIVIAGTSVGFIETLQSSPRYFKVGNILKICFGILVIFIGLYLLYLGM
ncbi:cytochrome c biogenesis CcdA family protein [Clostridium sp. UBA4548]|uniref:cytochrome c biogenesis CcdA family protein n=1 Tax=Clostridium sp. UBA4548 TaxID=1946361 RepID=UPI0025C1DD88|nr:cytochrome c biogenesis CcdA family protein [Clostridium sp. UBA4548]